MDALARSAGDRQITLTESEHLSALNDPRVTCSTGGPDRVVRTCDPHVQCNFTSGVVSNRSWVVMMGPTAGIVIKSFDHMDFCLYITVLGDTYINSDTCFVGVIPIDA